MADVFAVEVDGWGDVGETLAATAAQGFADGTFLLTMATPPPSDEIGARCYVEGASGVVGDGFYTLAEVAAGSATFRAAVADVTVASVTAAISARVEDHNRISDSIPLWVTGARAAARWNRDLVGVTSSAGQRIRSTGGIAKVDGFEFTHHTHAAGLAAIQAPTYREAIAGAVTLATSISSADASVDTFSAAIYAGEAAAAPTDAAQPAICGLEAIFFDGSATSSTVDGVTTYTSTPCVRGVLGTEARPIAAGAAIYGRLPSVVGQIVRAYVYPPTSASHSDRTPAYAGLGESVELAELGTVQRVAVASELLRPVRQLLGEAAGTSQNAETETPLLTAAARFYLLTMPPPAGAIVWALDELCAYQVTQVGTAAISVDGSGVERWEYERATELDTVSTYPMVKRAESGEVWADFNDPVSAGVVLYASPRAWRYRIYEDAAGTLRTIPPRDFEADAVGSLFGTPRDPICHVCGPVNWPRTMNSNAWVPSVPRLMRCNPIDALLTVLTSTGTHLVNGAWDYAPAAYGLGIAIARLDLATFTDIGDRLDAEGIDGGTLALLPETEATLGDWIDRLCQTYALALTTSTSGQLRLSDLSAVETSGLATLSESDLVADGRITVALGLSPAEAVESVSISYDRPWRSALVPESRVETVIRATGSGIQATFKRVKGRSLRIECPFAAAVDDATEAALAARWGRLMQLNRGIAGRLTVDVSPDYSAQIGDLVSVTLPGLPNAADDGGTMTSQIGRVVDRVHEMRPIGVPRDTLHVLIYGDTASTPRRNWGASGVVASVTSSTVFDLEPSVYTSAAFSSDAESFFSSAKIDIFDENWTLRSTVDRGTVATGSGDTMTLSSAAQDGGGALVPNVGDKIALSLESDQPAASRDDLGWQLATAPAYLWE